MPLAFNLIVVCLSVGTALSVDSHCCLSKRFFGKGLIVKATLPNGSNTPTMSQFSFQVEQDYDKKLQRLNGSNVVMTSNGTYVVAYQAIRDFNLKKSYNFNATHCNIEQIVDEEMQDGCVPKLFTKYGTFAFGSGNETTSVNGWVGTVGNVSWTMTTTVNDCTPVSYTRLGSEPDGSKVTETAQFVDMVQYSLTSDNVFDIPTHCKAGAAAVSVGR